MEKKQIIGKKSPEKSSNNQTVPWGTNDIKLRDVQLNKQPIPNRGEKVNGEEKTKENQ